MAVPRNRVSNARKNSRRAHDAKSPKQFTRCSNCREPKVPHTLCKACGHYNGRSYLAEETE